MLHLGDDCIFIVSFQTLYCKRPTTLKILDSSKSKRTTTFVMSSSVRALTS